MNSSLPLRVVELLCSRLCHELISPVGAINNGVELMGDDDPDFAKDAMKLIEESARKAGQRLMFYRFAYGSGGAAAQSGGARDIARGLLDGGKLRCDWPEAASALPPEWQKLACNMLVLAAESLPRGGIVRVAAPAADRVEVTAEGESINVTPELQAALTAEAAVDALTARTVHGYFTARLAFELGAPLTVAVQPPGRAFFSAFSSN